MQVKFSETLISISNLLLNEDHFIFDNIFYRQRKGLPMGSPISGIWAEMKLRKLDEQIKIKHRDKIKYWFRYIDDIFAVLDLLGRSFYP